WSLVDVLRGDAEPEFLERVDVVQPASFAVMVAFVVADAVADFSADDHAMALRWAAGRCAVVTTTDEVLKGS
ncbi:hypothetical protein AB0B67_39230, partial [Streptomyces spectabilis]